MPPSPAAEPLPEPAIREAGIGDADALASLHAACFPRPWAADELAALLADPSMLALIVGEPPAGFVLLRLAPDEADVLAIAVARDRRRLGLGRRLLKEAMKRAQARGVARLVLEVDAANSPALALYRALGFAEAGRRPAYYRRVEGGRGDALLLDRHLG